MLCDFWLTHCDRVGLQDELALDRDAAGEDGELADGEDGPADAGRRCRATRRGGRAGPRGSRWPLVGRPVLADAEDGQRAR